MGNWNHWEVTYLLDCVCGVAHKWWYRRGKVLVRRSRPGVSGGTVRTTGRRGPTMSVTNGM